MILRVSNLTLILMIFNNAVFSQPELKVFGSIQKIMHENDTSEKVRLNLMGPIANYYGLGAAARLDGEILILNGDTYTTRVWKGSLATDKSTDLGATLLVLAEVKAWDTLNLKHDIPSTQDLEKYLREEIFQNFAFPFIVLSREGAIQWHVVSPPENENEMQNHKMLGLHGEYSGNALLLGFFSESHQGVFTHQGQNTHIHFQSADKLYAGHVDELKLKKGDKLLIPVK